MLSVQAVVQKTVNYPDTIYLSVVLKYWLSLIFKGFLNVDFFYMKYAISLLSENFQVIFMM